MPAEDTATLRGMEYQDIDFELADGVAVIRLDRPEHLNTFSGTMGSELTHAYRRCDDDDAVRVVILTGAGTAFCAGADMTAGEETFASQNSEGFSASGVEMPAWEVRKPVIAAMNGHAIGIGFTLALQCDLRISAEEGKYGIVQVRRGVMPDAYSHWTLPRLVGMERAADLLLTGRKLTGREVVEIGLAGRCLPGDQVLGAALETARDIAENTAPLSVAISKRLLWESPGLTPAQVEHRETELHHHLMGREDAAEGVMAWLERRKPQWKSSVKKDWPEWPE
ncbi:MAG: enoyl-CoA hydratase-related protein [Myxococcota bacterium]